MRFDQNAIMEGQRRAFKALTSPMIAVHEQTISGSDDPMGAGKPIVKKTMRKNPHYVPAKLTTAPAMLIQELPWINTVTSFIFDFSINGPNQTPGVNNNIKIGKNDVFAFYGIQLLLGTGTSSPLFTYRARGVIPADDSVYNSVISIKTEASTYVDKVEGMYFRDVTNNALEYYGEIGLQIINPVRIISGELGVNQVILTLKNPIGALVLSANTVVSARLHGVYGQARG